MADIIPIKKPDPATGADVLARLEKLEDSFLAAVQDIRAVKSELKARADATPGLEELLGVKKVATILGESEEWVYRQAKAKKIPSIKLGKHWKFLPSQLQKWLERKQRLTVS